MPTVKRGRRGWIVVSRYRGHFNTHQLPSEQTIARLREANAVPLEVGCFEISGEVLGNLVRSGEAVTRGSLRKGRSRGARQERRWSRGSPPMSVPVSPAPGAGTTVVVNNISAPAPDQAPLTASPRCAHCGHKCAASALFCGQCGHPHKAAAAPPHAGAPSRAVKPVRAPLPWAEMLMAAMIFAAAVAVAWILIRRA